MTQKNSQEKPQLLDYALLWFQQYGKQCAVGAASLLFIVLLSLFFFAHKTDSSIDQTIEADLIASKLLKGDGSKIDSEERLNLITKLGTCADSSSSIYQQHQGLIGQELLISHEVKKSLPYLKGSEEFLQNQELPLFEKINSLTQALSIDQWDKALAISNELLTQPQFENHNTFPVAYSYILLSRYSIFSKMGNKTELAKTQDQLKQLLGLKNAGNRIPDEIITKIIPLIQDGSLSLLEISNEHPMN